MSTTISPGVLKALVDFTGETRVDLAIRLALQEAARFKLEELGGALRHFEQKYQMEFSQFEQAFQNESLPQASSYEVERDFLEWEGLLSRKQRVEKVLGGLE
ncbi:MAG: hypothetical protein HYW07_07485 [Candidatus Latescibacteria bacterium]|nr:hypothetical protein [Candidatus Latescibacterota bacterium]